jgi:DNA-binding NarL/FixJ family response regulator
MSEHTSSSAESVPPSETIRVVVADDHPIVRSGIITELRRHPDIDVVGEAVNGDDAFTIVCSREVDVLVLDINMPGLKVFDLVRSLQELSLPTQVLIITGHSDAEYAVALIRAGAKGYILKDEEPSTITAARRSWIASLSIPCAKTSRLRSLS